MGLCEWVGGANFMLWIEENRCRYVSVQAPLMHCAPVGGGCLWAGWWCPPLTSDGRFQLNVRAECTIFALDNTATLQWTEMHFFFALRYQYKDTVLAR